MAPRSASLSLLLLILTPGCAYATKVKRPDGSEAFRIHCADRAQCQEKATEVCAGDYEVVSSSTQMDGYVDNGTGYAERPHEMVIACRADVAVCREFKTRTEATCITPRNDRAERNPIHAR